MSYDRWTEPRLITFLRKLAAASASQKAALQVTRRSFTMECSHDCINDSLKISAPVELPLFSFFSSPACAPRTNTTSGSGVSVPTRVIFVLFCLRLHERIKLDRVLKRTNIARKTRWLGRDPMTKRRKTVLEHLLCSVLQQTFFTPLLLSGCLLTAGCEGEVISNCTQWPLSYTLLAALDAKWSGLGVQIAPRLEVHCVRRCYSADLGCERQSFELLLPLYAFPYGFLFWLLIGTRGSSVPHTHNTKPVAVWKP